VKVTLLLCDFVEAADGKLFILGGGWSLKGFGTPMAVAALIEVPWVEANRQHRWKLSLVDGDGHAVQAPGPLGDPVGIEAGGPFEVGRPPGIPEGTALNLPLAINVGPLPLPTGRYTWRFEIDGQGEEDWHIDFTAVAGPPQYP
jgi:hypothetical protein